MSLHAFDDVDDALDATRAFLLPVDRGRWLRLAFVVLFLGGAGFNAPVGNYEIPAGDTGGPAVGPEPELTRTVLLAIAAVVAVLLLLALLYVFVGSVMEFVLVRSLATEDVHVRRYWSEHLGQGLRLFGFRIALGLIALVAVGGMALVLFAPLFSGVAIPFSLALLVVLAPVLLLGALILALVNGFTSAFVVPIMIHEETGVLPAWGQLWPTIRADWKEYAAYAIVSWAFSAGLGIAVGIVMVVIALVLLIPAAIIGIVGFLLLMAAPPVGILVLVVVGALYALTLILAYAITQVAVQSYLRYYALFVLGDTNPDLDLIADRRAAVRGEPT